MTARDLRFSVPHLKRCCQVSLDEWAAMWAPAESLFSAEVISSSLADISFHSHSSGKFIAKLQPRPLAEALEVHRRIMAAVISSCNRGCISSDTFFEKLTLVNNKLHANFPHAFSQPQEPDGIVTRLIFERS
jgi:hypothetical protein